MQRFTLSRGILLGLFLLLTLALTAQTEDGNKHNFAVRYVMPNYILPLSNVPSNLDGSESFGSGVELEYQRRFNNNFLLGVPIRLSTATAIRRNNVDLSMPVLDRDIGELGAVGADLLLLFEPIAKQSFFDPQLFAGIGVFSENFKATTVEVPLGVNLNVRLGESFYLSPQASYRLALDEDAGDIRKNIQLGIGMHLVLGGKNIPPPPPPVVDTDGDGIPDATDQCPEAAGPLALLGCPDTDGDGLADKNDKCPDVAGPATMMGCPDTDGDGVTDADDNCPDKAGPASNKGCPVTDRDGDGVADADDKCPDQPGTIANNGCPIFDRDNDGVADADDKCPDQAGSAAMMGCPDSDGDGVADPQDRCPDKAGPASAQGCPDTDGDGVADPDDRCPDEAGTSANRGCPELTVEDKETIDFAIQNINFETASDRLTASSREVLEQVKDILKRYPAYTLSIGGHTDSVGPTDSNQRLSEKRAQSVRNYLIASGIREGRMTAQGFGESVPIGDNRYAAGREQNRRVTLDLVVN